MAEKKTSTRDHHTQRIEARTSLAGELGKPEHAERRRRAGLVESDLATIVRTGAEAAVQDRLQHEDLAAQRQGQKDLLQAREIVETETEEIRNRLPAVIQDLAAVAATQALAGWLAVASFDRFRVREVTPAAPTGTPPAAPAAHERVTREDRMSRAHSLAQFLQAILQPERAAIVEALGQRGMNRDRLTKLAQTAETLVGKLGDKAVLKPAEATEREAAAVAAQKLKWEACRRMIRAAVRGNADLERLWAAC